MNFTKKYFLFFLIFFGFGTVNAQIENEIRAYVDSSEIIVNNGRKLLVQNIQDKNYVKAAEISTYLNKISDERRCKTLTFNENLMLSSLCSNWQDWLHKAENFNTDTRGVCYENGYKISNFLYQDLYENVDLYIERTSKLNISDEEKELFELYFTYIKNYCEQNEAYKIKNRNIKHKYPNSKYKKFIDSYMPEPEKKFSFGYGFGVSALSQTGNLPEYFYTISPLYTFSVDFNVDKIYFSMNFIGGDLELQKNLQNPGGYNYTFLPKDKFSFFDAGIKGGYNMNVNEKLKVTPYLSIGGSSLESNLYNSDADSNIEFKVYDSFSFGAGIHTEYKIAAWKMNNPYYYYGTNNTNGVSFLSLSFDAGYKYIAFHQYTPITGDILYLNMGLIWLIGN